MDVPSNGGRDRLSNSLKLFFQPHTRQEELHMSQRWIRTALVAALLVAPATFITASAQGFAARRNPLRVALRAVGVTDAQKQQIKAVAKQHQGEAQTVRRQVVAARGALREAVTAVPPNDAAVTEASANLAAAQAQATAARAKAVAEIFRLLTPEQQQKLQRLVARRKMMMQRKG